MTLIGFLTFVHIVVAFFMILVVLIQGGNSGGIGAALGGGGGGNSSGFFGASGGNKLFSRLTYGAAAIFMTTSIALTAKSSSKGDVGLADKLEQAAENESVQPDAKPEENAPKDETSK